MRSICSRFKTRGSNRGCDKRSSGRVEEPIVFVRLDTWAETDGFKVLSKLMKMQLLQECT